MIKPDGQLISAKQSERTPLKVLHVEVTSVQQGTLKSGVQWVAAPSSFSILKENKIKHVLSVPSTGGRRDNILFGSQENKIIAVSSVVAPAQFARRQDVGRGSTVVAAVTLKSIVLTPPLNKSKDGVLLFGRWQSLWGTEKQQINTGYKIP